MGRVARLQSARVTRWVETYPGKNLVRWYRKAFGVDELCAVVELRELGVPIPAEREERLRKQAANQARTVADWKPEESTGDWVREFPWSDDSFAFIAGYTSAGFPYGVIREEDDEDSSYLWRGDLDVEVHPDESR